MFGIINGIKAFVRDIVLGSTAKLTTIDNVDLQIQPGTGGVTRFGGEVNSHGFTSVGAVVLDRMSARRLCYFDTGLDVPNDNYLYFGFSYSFLGWRTNQTNPGTVFYGNYLLFADTADTSTNWAKAAPSNPTIFIQSADQTNVNKYVSFAHNQTDYAQTIGYGGRVTRHLTPVELADEASFDLPDATAGHGFLLVGNSEEYADFVWDNAGNVDIISASANVVTTDDDTYFCIFDNGTQVRVRNRLGSAKKVMFSYDYTTP